MLQKIQHIGYLTHNLSAAVSWFEKSFGAVNSGGGPISQSYAVPSGGRNAYMRFGRVEAEIIFPRKIRFRAGTIQGSQPRAPHVVLDCRQTSTR